MALKKDANIDTIEEITEDAVENKTEGTPKEADGEVTENVAEETKNVAEETENVAEEAMENATEETDECITGAGDAEEAMNDDSFEDGEEDLSDDAAEAAFEEIFGDIPEKDEIESHSHRNKEKKSKAGLLLGIGWAIFVVLCALYVYLFFIKETPPGKYNTVEIQIPEGANYRLCDIDEINQLISDYLAARADGDQAALQAMVTDPDQFNQVAGIEIVAGYTEAYKNITCYIADGYDENSYIVIELSNIVIENVKSQPLDVITFYVVRQEDGSYKIDNSDLPVEVENYIEEVKSTQYIQDIYLHVKENEDYIMETDQTFIDFLNEINQSDKIE